MLRAAGRYGGYGDDPHSGWYGGYGSGGSVNTRNDRSALAGAEAWGNGPAEFIMPPGAGDYNSTLLELDAARKQAAGAPAAPTGAASGAGSDWRGGGGSARGAALVCAAGLAAAWLAA